MLNRRDFITSLARNSIFVALVGISGYLLFKEKPLDSETCNFDFICKNCKKLDSCSIDEAVQHKNKI